MTNVRVRLIRPQLDEQPPTSRLPARWHMKKRGREKKKKQAPAGKNSGVLTSERRPHGEVVVIYPEELLRFGHRRFGHVGAALVNGAAESETEAGGWVGG